MRGTESNTLHPRSRAHQIKQLTIGNCVFTLEGCAELVRLITRNISSFSGTKDLSAWHRIQRISSADFIGNEHEHQSRESIIKNYKRCGKETSSRQQGRGTNNNNNNKINKKKPFSLFVSIRKPGCVKLSEFLLLIPGETETIRYKTLTWYGRLLAYGPRPIFCWIRTSQLSCLSFISNYMTAGL